jgi:hypothetical protein
MWTGSLVGGKSASKQYGSDRTCEEPVCTTPLSTYNPNPKCSVHKRSPIMLTEGTERRSLDVREPPARARSKNTRQRR